VELVGKVESNQRSDIRDQEAGALSGYPVMGFDVEILRRGRDLLLRTTIRKSGLVQSARLRRRPLQKLTRTVVERLVPDN
jgi:hypothetical protein